jgi:hypothetical protein
MRIYIYAVQLYSLKPAAKRICAYSRPMFYHGGRGGRIENHSISKMKGEVYV